MAGTVIGRVHGLRGCGGMRGVEGEGKDAPQFSVPGAMFRGLEGREDVSGWSLYGK